MAVIWFSAFYALNGFFFQGCKKRDKKNASNISETGEIRIFWIVFNQHACGTVRRLCKLY